MKGKILDALKQKYVKLGLSDDVFERVASSMETFVTDENLNDFVAKAEEILKQYQSIEDRARAGRDAAKRKEDELNARIAELEGQIKNPKNDDDDNKPDLVEQIKQAVAEATKPLQDKIDTLEHANTLKDSVNTAHETFFANDYVKKYKDEGQDAWERALEINEAQGGKMTADELSAKALGYFNKAVSRIGVDTSQPFKAEDHSNDEVTDWSAERKRLQDEGRIPKEND